ncbi:MAG TPA: Holliday junction resolvase-like protein [Candidatus Nanoarchaeia archaeon]|nr:Holliday junction resolvase-like protein [Candidatus Nanoarchaeia archaeon]
MEQSDMVLFGILFLMILYIGYLIGKFIERKKAESEKPEIREDAIKHSRAVLAGQFSEQMSPYLPGFGHKPTESRFIGKPIDFIVFKGMDEKKIEEVVFVEVKSGKNVLSPVQKSLKSAIEGKKVSWHEYKVPENVTNRDGKHL